MHFTYNAHGKPALTDYPHLFFNLSHTAGLSLLGVHTAPIGVDVERIDRVVEAEDLAKRFFSPADYQWITEPPAEAAAIWSTVLERFYVIWTCKEAYVKMRGVGLSLSLSDWSVNMSLIPVEAAGRVLYAGVIQYDVPGQLWVWQPEPGFCAAVCRE
ncbi:MAG: hypothetical protein A3J38_04520 [Gammaproteobacteria bacterium RIFCSPHIGHO2_12_FULL_45_9]|nr:MAG: hypothetical protein A3J38_04520 [Gammaproteobacteria bacterium RIFCSPHIGHO2_12_FULL_45_9]